MGASFESLCVQLNLKDYKGVVFLVNYRIAISQIGDVYCRFADRVQPYDPVMRPCVKPHIR